MNLTKELWRNNTVKITLLNSLISTLVVGWCVFGVLVHGWQILFYPLAWGGIVAAFFVLNLLHDRSADTASAGSTAKPKADPEPEENGQANQSVIKNQSSTAVSAR